MMLVGGLFVIEAKNDSTLSNRLVKLLALARGIYELLNFQKVFKQVLTIGEQLLMLKNQNAPQYCNNMRKSHSFQCGMGGGGIKAP